jgi:alpha-glucosidase (family GH31 glycosyl hydrolase)
MYGPEISNVVESFAEIIGKPALIPKYALGFFFSN